MSRRHPRLLASLLAGTALVAGLAITIGPAQAVSAVYTSLTSVPIGSDAERADGNGITIKDGTVAGPAAASPYPASVQLDGLVGTVTDVNVTLKGFRHYWPRDVDVMLVSPSGSRATIMSDTAGSAPITGVDLTLDDQAAGGIPEDGVMTGLYRPTNNNYDGADTFPFPAPSAAVASALSTFNGIDGNGQWQLYVVDDAHDGYVGSIDGWSLDVTTTGAPVYPSSIAVSGATKGVTDVDVYLNGLSHSWPSEVDVLLVGPEGQQATILSDAGGNASIQDVNLVLDDSAAAPVGYPIASGSFQPTNVASGGDSFPPPAPTANGSSSLSVFNGTDPNGVWQLFVADDASRSRGVLGGWYLKITTVDGPTAPTITQPATGSTEADGSFSVGGAAQPGSTVTLRNNGAALATTQASGGQWSIPVAGLPAGSHSFTATATDSFGNTSAPSSAVLVTVASVTAGGGGTTDRTGPRVSATSPGDRADGVSRRATVTARLSEVIRPATVTRTTAYLVRAGTTRHLPATVRVSSDRRAIVITPSRPLRAHTTYKAVITTAVRDLAGNRLDQVRAKSGLQGKAWRFTTR
jgi:subtilisin-like proprotein convertase family protein